jgi:branched-chain amino acid transport system ATP-binding protein
MSATVTATQATGDALTITGLTAGYGRFAVLNGVDLHVGRGEALGLVGPNGAGKTTVMHLRSERARIPELLASVYELFPVLERYRHRPSTALSGGEQQMVAIGRSLMSDPELLLLDEPSLGLAPLAIEDVIRALLALRERGRSLLIVEQRIDLVLRVCDRINVMVGGRIVFEDQASAVDRDERAVIDAYLG